MLNKGGVRYNTNALTVDLAEGDTVPCPKCAERHVVQRDARPGRQVNTLTGEVRSIRNAALYIDCPQAPGPIIVGMDGKALPTPLELTPRPPAQS